MLGILSPWSLCHSQVRMVCCKEVCTALYFLDQILPSNNEVEAFQSETALMELLLWLIRRILRHRSILDRSACKSVITVRNELMTSCPTLGIPTETLTVPSQAQGICQSCLYEMTYFSVGRDMLSSDAACTCTTRTTLSRFCNLT